METHVYEYKKIVHYDRRDIGYGTSPPFFSTRIYSTLPQKWATDMKYLLKKTLH